MKPTGTHLMNTSAPVGGMVRSIASKTPLANNTKKLFMECPVCGNGFLRPAAWAKRVNISYCSRACSWAGRVINIACSCSVCQKPMLVKPGEISKKTTCSAECSSAKKRSRGKTHKPTALAAYQRAVKELHARERCSRCETAHGPWVARGLRAVIENGALPSIDSSTAFLVCQRCHFMEVGVIGGLKRQEIGRQHAKDA